jgi:hypothetical protein
MLSRALSSATVMLLIAYFAVIPVQAQNLEAGKSPSQIFAGTCTACHKSPRGLLKTVPAGSLPGFLRQHYTTSGEMASLLSGFLVSNGAADTRYVGTQPRQGKDAKSEERPAGPPDQLDRFGRRLRPVAGPAQEAARPGAEPRQAARPDADGLSPQAEPGRHGRSARRLARPGEAPDAANPAVEGEAPAQAASERGPAGRKSVAKHRLSKRGKPGGEEPPKADAPKNDTAKTDAKIDAAKDEPSKGEPAKDDTPKSETAKGEDSKPEGSKPEGTKPESTRPAGEGKSEAAKVDAPKETGSGEPAALRTDPVPPVTPAPAPSDSPAVSAAVSSGTPEPAPSAPAALPAPPAVTASVPPPLPPVAPAGPPAPPISQ